MTVYIGNAFSLSMLDRDGQRRFPQPVTLAYARLVVGRRFVSCVGHEETAELITQALGLEMGDKVRPNRVGVKLTDDDTLVVAQYIGPRLPEGATKLPDGARFEWWVI
jgi:hypothetical protein